MKSLILAGWGWVDYACAAALALRHHKDSDILGMSTRRLPEFLLEVRGYEEIIILGVGLTGDPEMLEKTIGRLSAKHVRVIWISSLSLPESVSKETCSKIEHFVYGSGITEAVGKYYELPYGDLQPILDENKDSAVQKNLHLLAASMYFYRNYQDEKAYGNAIRHIAAKDTDARWTDSERHMVEHFKRYGNRELVGISKAMKELQEKINLVASRDRARVMIYGESGTGKETVALQIHNKSSRKDEPYIAFNCASVTPNLLESRFLGHEKGAFTGANELKHGIFEQADGGTLFLDEVGELPLEAQGILLRVLEGGRFTRIGDKEEVAVDVRLITATNRDLAAMVRDGKFREDLFHRLNVIQIRVPPLREHKEDIEKIANGYWLKQHKHRLGSEQIDVLMSYDYPGNVRELFNLLERASVLEESDFQKLLEEHKLLTASIKPNTEETYPDNLEEMTRVHVRKVYEKCGRNISKTAEALNAARNTVKKYLDI